MSAVFPTTLTSLLAESSRPVVNMTVVTVSLAVLLVAIVGGYAYAQWVVMVRTRGQHLREQLF